VSTMEARAGLWSVLEEEIAAQVPADDGPEEASGLWARLAVLVDPGELRPKLAPDIEIREFHLRWGGDYTMVANPRELLHYEIKPNEGKLLRLMDGTRTLKEIMVGQLEESGDLELSGVADLVQTLYAGNFLDRRFLDVDEAVERAVHPVTPAREKARKFATSLSIEWQGADQPIRRLYERGLRWVFTLWAQIVFAGLTAVGLVAFLAVARSHRYSLAGRSLTLAFVVLLVLNWSLTLMHELGHATVLIHYKRKVKGAGFLIYFGSPALYIEAADGLMMSRGQRILMAFAGGYTEMLFCGIAAILLWAFSGVFGPNSLLGPTLYKFAVLGYLVIFLNWIPLLELDGYWMMGDLIQVRDLRPRSLSFIRHELLHRVRERRGLTKQEWGLTLYGVVGLLFTVFVGYISYFFWREVFGGLVGNLWRGGLVTRTLLFALALLVVGPIIRGAINVARVIAGRIAALAARIRFRLQRSWRVEAAALIDGLPIFDDVPEDVLSDLAGRVKLRVIAPGQAVVRQGERATAFYVVRRGTLHVVDQDPHTGNERALRVLGRGEGFGELGLAEGSARSATVRALDSAQVFEIDKGTFDRLLAQMVHVPDFGPSFQRIGELRELSSFSHLEPDELGALLEHGAWVSFAPGEVIIEQGEVGDAFFAIGSGQVRVYADDELKTTMGPGSYFGEIALLLDVPRTATVVAHTPVRAFRLEREGFDRLVKESFGRGTLNPAIAPDRVWQH
jgi:CRP-like cAMP-binding protein